MAIGKNKKLKTGKKLGRKKAHDPFLRKEWYDVIAPNQFQVRAAGKTCVTKTTGLKVASDALKGRIFEFNQADLNEEEDQSYRKILLRVDDVQGKKCLTNFHGMNLTTDRLRSLIRKWQTLIEARADVKTLDGYTLRIFCIAFTARMANMAKRVGHPQAVYAQANRIRRIRKRMIEIITREATTCELRELVNKFIPETISKRIKKSCHGIYPIDNVYIRKVKVLKLPKFDAGKLAEIHGEVAREDTGKAVEAAAAAEEAAAEPPKPVEPPVGDVAKEEKKPAAEKK
jgi:small subunit ribosomal protein S3Ae